MLQYAKQVNLYLLVLMGMMLLINNCDDSSSPTKIEEESVIWKIDESYSRTGKILLNAHVFNGKFIVAGLYKLTMYDTSSVEQRISGTPANNRALNSKPAMGGPFVMYAGNEGIQLYLNSPAYWWGNANSQSFPFSYYFRLSDFNLCYSDRAKVVADSYKKMMGAFNNQNQFLTVISDTSQMHNENLSFCLINLNPAETVWSGITCLELEPQIKRIQLNTSYTILLSQIASYQDLFLVSLGGDLYVIDSAGNMNIAEGMSGDIADFFAYHDTLYAVKKYVNELYYSINRGYTWNFYASGLPSDEIRFFEIDDQLCFYVYSQIATLDLPGGSIQELDNAGLEGNEITSVNKYDGKVWVTTLSGMFTKEAGEFFTPRKSNQASSLPKAIIRP